MSEKYLTGAIMLNIELLPAMSHLTSVGKSLKETLDVVRLPTDILRSASSRLIQPAEGADEVNNASGPAANAYTTWTPLLDRVATLASLVNQFADVRSGWVSRYCSVFTILADSSVCQDGIYYSLMSIRSKQPP